MYHVCSILQIILWVSSDVFEYCWRQGKGEIILPPPIR
jgi:hypothetical protein